MSRAQEITAPCLIAILIVLGGFWVAKPHRYVGPPIKGAGKAGDDFVRIEGSVVTEFGSGLLLGTWSSPLERRQQFEIKVPLEYTDKEQTSFSYDSVSALLETSQTPLQTSWQFKPVGIGLHLIVLIGTFLAIRFVIALNFRKQESTPQEMHTTINSEQGEEADAE